MIYIRRQRVLLMALLGLLAYSGFAENVVHNVARGETVYSISRLYRVSQEDLMRQNNLADASRLQAGMRLVIPVRANNPLPVITSVPVPAPAYSEYTVSRNDTLYSIARSRGVTLQALREINGFSKNYVLKAGEKIKIPASNYVPAPASSRPAPISPARTAGRTGDTSIRWPVAATEILYMTSNSGVLVSGRESESIKSLSGGTVVHASPWRGYGNVAVVETSDGYRYLYGACETLSVRKGDIIEAGTELGKLGIYPASGRPDLVLIVSHNGSPVDPAKAPRF
ncbi:MAG: M23 family metallopeptidase [Treponema sp.]|jgi:murein DD-endopeptidase MepM/ murein hydrolase activator NlpD|nr:M23 family metallopeptidase [Treponema sp.]